MDVGHCDNVDVPLECRGNMLDKDCCVSEDGTEQVTWYAILRVELHRYGFLEHQRSILYALQVGLQQE
jgi:hypothetical protein